MKLIQKSFILIGLAAVAGVASAQQNPLDIGANVGLYMPTSGPIKDAFGKQVFRWGLGGVGQTRTGNVRIGTEFDFISANKNGNRMMIIPFLFTAEQQLTFDEYATTKPYIKAIAGPTYMDYAVGSGVARRDGKVINFTYGAELGVVINSSMRLSARYNVFPKTNGLDFSGLSLSATFALR